VIDHYLGSAWAADCVALTGDLVQDDSRQAYEHIRSLLGHLGIPVLCLPGNHDIRPLMRAVLNEPPFHYGGAIRLGDWELVAVDSCVDGSAGGRVDEDELAQLASRLAASNAAHILVCLHHPPVPVDSAWLEAVGLSNRDQVLSLLAGNDRVRGVLFGHIHQAVETTARGLSVIGTPSTCSQFKPGSDTFAVDDRPPAYRRIRLHPDGRIGSDLIWVD